MNLCHGIVVGAVHAIQYSEGIIGGWHNAVVGKEIVFLNPVAIYIQPAIKKRKAGGRTESFT
jgi:hypothetical protein